MGRHLPNSLTFELTALSRWDFGVSPLGRGECALRWGAGRVEWITANLKTRQTVAKKSLAGHQTCFCFPLGTQQGHTFQPSRKLSGSHVTELRRAVGRRDMHLSLPGLARETFPFATFPVRPTPPRPRKSPCTGGAASRWKETGP